MNSSQLTQTIKSEAGRQGFDWVGVTQAARPAGFENLKNWIDEGFAGEMNYLADRLPAYRHPDSILDGAQSVVMLALNYFSQPRSAPARNAGKIARYAWGEVDYHDLVHQKLKAVCRSLRELDPQLGVRGIVDTAPLLEREFAQLAGFGWLAKNTMLINKQQGSWFFLAAIVLDRELDYDPPQTTAHCGTCTACLTACPTKAFTEPGTLDATRCISYLTIEHRSAIPHELRPLMDNWILGCDVCQDVCPWNRKATPSNEPKFEPLPNQNPIDLIELFDLDDDQFRARFRKTPLWRPKRKGILRNAAIALGNHPTPNAESALAKGLNDCEPLVRGAAAWALGQFQTPTSLELLKARQSIEIDAEVLTEIADAAATHGKRPG